jgi:hypothetical protein
MQTKKATKSNTLRIRVSNHELTKLESYAKKHGWTISHVIREYIRRLPNREEKEEKNI